MKRTHRVLDASLFCISGLIGGLRLDHVNYILFTKYITPCLPWLLLRGVGCLRIRYHNSVPAKREVSDQS